MKLMFKILTFIATTSAIIALIVKKPFMPFKKMLKHPFPEKKFDLLKKLHIPTICFSPRKKGFQLFHLRLPFGFLHK